MLRVSVIWSILLYLPVIAHQFASSKFWFHNLKLKHDLSTISSLLFKAVEKLRIGEQCDVAKATHTKAKEFPVITDTCSDIYGDKSMGIPPIIVIGQKVGVGMLFTLTSFKILTELLFCHFTAKTRFFKGCSIRGYFWKRCPLAG